MRSLERRLLRLEAQRSKAAKPLVLFSKIDIPDDAVIAVACGRGSVGRLAGQGIGELLALAAHELQSHILWAVYAAPVPSPVPQSTPVATASAKPVDLAGIGRRATVTELRRWGVLPRP